MAHRVYLAVDMGASSGRHVVGRFDGNRFSLEEIYRFENGPVAVGDHLFWDVLGLWNHVQIGMRAAAQRHGADLKSIGVDTWGVDFGLLDKDDQLVGNPFHYRDRRNEGMLVAAQKSVSKEEIFAQTGLQFMEINTLYQLLSMKLSKSAQFDAARSFLMMPDLFNWLLTGIKSNERTNASTTQFYNPQQHAWALPLLKKLELPTHILGNLVEPGMRLGHLRTSVADATNLKHLEVIAPGTHDTASAVMAVPVDKQGTGLVPNWCYISSGTWSLMGVEIRQPIITDKCLKLNFTNEAGVGGTTRLLKNISGLWLIQECRRIWNQSGRNLTWDDLNHFSATADPLVSLINPDAPDFLSPASMPEAIRSFCHRTGQPVPNDEGAIIRCCVESLALRYRVVLGMLEELIGGKLQTIHIVGGGTQNRQLSKATADACNRTVITGPIEATAIGNVMMQAVALGDIGSIDQARQIVRKSFLVEHFEPKHSAEWDDAFGRFQEICRVTS
jgi:rhamnulokinase